MALQGTDWKGHDGTAESLGPVFQEALIKFVVSSSLAWLVKMDGTPLEPEKPPRAVIVLTTNARAANMGLQVDDVLATAKDAFTGFPQALDRVKRTELSQAYFTVFKKCLRVHLSSPAFITHKQKVFWDRSGDDADDVDADSLSEPEDGPLVVTPSASVAAPARTEAAAATNGIV